MKGNTKFERGAHAPGCGEEDSFSFNEIGDMAKRRLSLNKQLVVDIAFIVGIVAGFAALIIIGACCGV